MGKESQTVIIDFGSSKITAAVGVRGVNGTFIVKGRCSFSYDGFSDGSFFDTEAVKKILFSITENVKKVVKENLETVYVGVPGAFSQVFVKDSQISFPKKKKITSKDVDSLFDSAFMLSSSKYTLINRSAVIYEMEDGRKTANPVGETSEILKGKLSFVVGDNYFIDIVKQPLVSAGFNNVEFISTAFCEALYLLEPEIRDRVAVICDVGYISTTVTVIQGDALISQKEIGFGGGYITAAITEKYNIDFSVAESLKSKINLCKKSNGAYDLISDDNGEFYSFDELKETILGVLDNLCEEISKSFEDFGYEIPEYVPLNITGGGVSYLRGAKEHIAGRLNMNVVVLAPKVPLMEKPTESSFLSLLDFATLMNA